MRFLNALFRMNSDTISLILALITINYKVFIILKAYIYTVFLKIILDNFQKNKKERLFVKKSLSYVIWRYI